MNARLAGKRIIVTGAARGIGLAMVRCFAAAGARVVLADVDVTVGLQQATRSRDEGHAVDFVGIDVTDEHSVATGVAKAVDLMQGIDALVNNAGGSSLNDGALTDFALDEFWRTIRIDLLGTVLMSRAIIPLLIKRGGGAVINMGSLLAERGVAGRDAYTAAKGGVHALTRSMAVNYAPAKVRVNCIAPGAVLSERMRGFIRDDPRVQANIAKHLLGLPEPEEIAEMALYLLSDAARHVTGSIIRIDGGRGAAG
jgi:NAD(P)-dependent dehydrogenase (short-subunit alcohol dehydrogenase family)